MTTIAEQFIPPIERPIRIPPGVSVEQADPPVAAAGERSSWQLRFRLVGDVTGGERLKCQLFAPRNNRRVAFVPGIGDDWFGDLPMAVRSDSGAPWEFQPDARPGAVTLTAPPEGLAAGEMLLVDLGNAATGALVEAPRMRMLGKFFILYRPAAEDDYPLTWGEDNAGQILGACILHILGGAVDHLHAYAPSQAVVGEPLEVLIRPEDRYHNLATEPVADVAVFAGDQRVDEQSRPVPGTACLRVRIRLGAEGSFRLTVRDLARGLEGRTNPVVCTAAPADRQVLWGMIHGHTEMSDGVGTLGEYFRQMRDEAGLDFAATSDHDHVWETPDSYWDLACRKAAEWNEPGRFVAFAGYEWAKWRKRGDGDRNVYYLHDDRPMYRSDDGHYPTPPDLFAALADEEATVIVHHPSHSGNWCDWKDHDRRLERLVEIYQCRGSAECAADDGNPLPEVRGDSPSVAVGYVQNALAMGWRVGFTGGGDDHIGSAGTDYPGWPSGYGDRVYTAGLTAVQATDRTREAIWDAMLARRTVATSGPRMLLTFTLDGHPIGSELKASASPSVNDRRTIRVAFCGAADLARIDIIRNNVVVHTITGDGPDWEGEWVDDTPLRDALMPAAAYCDRPFCFYYVRAVQTDGEVAWASPVWID